MYIHQLYPTHMLCKNLESILAASGSLALLAFLSPECSPNQNGLETTCMQQVAQAPASLYEAAPGPLAACTLSPRRKPQVLPKKKDVNKSLYVVCGWPWNSQWRLPGRRCCQYLAPSLQQCRSCSAALALGLDCTSRHQTPQLLPPPSMPFVGSKAHWLNELDFPRMWLIDFDAAEELQEYLLSLFKFNFEIDLAS